MTRFDRMRCVAGIVLALAGPACGGANGGMARDTAYVEILRAKISTVRHAIDETRHAIALSQGAPYLPELYLRLGELLSEEAKYHYRVAAERQQSSTEALHVPQVRLLKERAIATYRMILRVFPDTALADQALFNIAYEQRELGNFDDMKVALEDLVQRFPQSRLRAEGLLILGDYHFDRSELEPAARYYRQIVEGEPSRVTALARYKLAWVSVNEGDCDKALVDFEAALETARVADAATPTTGGARDDAPQSNEAIDVRRTALVDLVYCYSQEREAAHAVEYLHAHSHDRATYVAGLERMARRYAVMDEAQGALSVTRELLRLGPVNMDRLEDARQLHTALRAVQTYDHIGDDTHLLLSVLNRYVERVALTGDTRTTLIREFEGYARDLLTRAQTRMGTLSGERQHDFAISLADGYQAYLDTFREGDNRTEMMLNMGDVLATASRPFEAGERTLQGALALAPRAAERRDALYDAVVRLQLALTAESHTDHFDRVLARAGLRRAGRELLRYSPEPERARRVKFAIAQSYYDEGLFREAIDRLTAVAYEYPRTDEAKASMRLVLDSYNTLNDSQGLIQAARRFADAGSPADDELRGEIAPIIASAEQRLLDEVSLEAAGGDGGDIGVLVDFAQRNRGSALGERALVNAFIAGRAVGDTAQLYRLGEEIAEQYPQSEQLPGILSTLGQMALARFEVDRASEFLRRGAAANEAQRVPLLVASGELLEELGKDDEAKTRYQEAIAAAGDVRARQEPLERLSRLLERRGDARATQSTLEPLIEGADAIVVARYGLAQVANGAPEQAEQSLQRVLAGGDGIPPDALARAHYGMGEVLFKTLEGYPALDSTDFIEEYMTLLDVTQQSYLNAARQGTADFTPAALARLAVVTRTAAARVRAATLPSDLPADARAVLQQALEGRVQQMEATATEALGACADQAWGSAVFSPVVIACLKGDPGTFTLPTYDSATAREARETANAEELRQTISRNPENLEALRALGERFLDGNDPHSARLVFASAAEHGGGPLEENLLGIANQRIGLRSAAMEAFARAARGGLEAGRQNLMTMLRQAGATQAVDRARERFPEGREGGRLLGNR